MLSEIFKAYDVRSTYPDKVNEDTAWKVGYAAGQFLQKQAPPSAPELPLALPNTVLVSRDMRPHSESLAEALIEGLRASGFDVIDLGVCDTSFIYFAINHLACRGGIQTTASHNPIQYNGFKISGQQAKPIGGATGLKDIQRLAESAGERGSVAATGKLEQRDLWPEYKQHIHQFLDCGSRKLKVFIDASMGWREKWCRLFSMVCRSWILSR